MKISLNYFCELGSQLRCDTLIPCIFQGEMGSAGSVGPSGPQVDTHTVHVPEVCLFKVMMKMFEKYVSLKPCVCAFIQGPPGLEGQIGPPGLRGPQVRAVQGQTFSSFSLYLFLNCVYLHRDIQD